MPKSKLKEAVQKAVAEERAGIAKERAALGLERAALGLERADIVKAGAALDGEVTKGLAKVTKRDVKGLAMIAKERTRALADIAKERAELDRERVQMHTHKEAQEGRVELNVGSHRFQTSINALRRVPGTFFDAYFSGRYSQDVCEDGSIFVDRDGKHFGHILQYLRDGKVSVADYDPAEVSIDLLQWLKHEFSFYSINLYAERQEVLFAMGGIGSRNETLMRLDRYDTTSGRWRELEPLAQTRHDFGVCELDGEFYVAGGKDEDNNYMATVERFSPLHGTWSVAPSLPRARCANGNVAVGDAMHVVGGVENVAGAITIVASILEFDNDTQAWCELAPMPAPRAYSAVCVLGGEIFVFGGLNERKSISATTYRYNKDANKWSTLAPMAKDMCCHSACVLEDKIYVIGGQLADGTSVSRNVSIFDPAANDWTEMAPLLTPRTMFTSFVLGGHMHVVGGNDGAVMLASVERYSVASNSWSEVREMALGSARQSYGAFTMRVEVDLFDRLIAKARRAQFGDGGQYGDGDDGYGPSPSGSEDDEGDEDRNVF
jgi:hypothetical protein